ncbi:GNAT family N-acetyltransferase [Cupriavidus sp. D39]|nr:GNAT family N-acetyltransferase [Cupriavidus sp. D39]
MRFFHLAVLDKRVVGCACAEQYGETVVVRSVGVLQEYRGHQIATHLVGSMLTRARADGCTKAVLITAGRLGLSNHCDFRSRSSNPCRRKFGYPRPSWEDLAGEGIQDFHGLASCTTCREESISRASQRRWLARKPHTQARSNTSQSTTRKAGPASKSARLCL